MPNRAKLPPFSINPAGRQGERLASEETGQFGATTWAADELSRWANAVANGEVPFPQGIGGQQRETLLAEIQRRRRARLVRFIASAIARDIFRSQPQ